MTRHAIPRLGTCACLLVALLFGISGAVELRLTPIATEAFGYRSRVFVIEDRIEPGPDSGDFSVTSKGDATLIVNLARRWAARLQYGYSFTEFVKAENSNTNAHGGELMLGHALTERFILDAGVRGSSERVHGFRLNDADRVGGLVRARFSRIPEETIEASYAHGERRFPRRRRFVLVTDPPLTVFGPVQIGGGETVIPRGAQADREDTASLSLSRNLPADVRLRAGVGYLANGSNFDNGRWRMANAGIDLRAKLRWDVTPSLSFQYARRRFADLEVAPGKVRRDHVLAISAAVGVPLAKWIGVRLEGGALIDQANASRADFTAASAMLSVSVKPPETMVWGTR